MIVGAKFCGAIPHRRDVRIMQFDVQPHVCVSWLFDISGVKPRLFGMVVFHLRVLI